MMELTREEVAALPLDIAIAYIEGYRWRWSKHNHWYVTYPDGREREEGMGRWTQFDPETGKKNKPPKYPDYYQLDGFKPYGQYQDNKSVAFNLVVKHRLTIRSIPMQGGGFMWGVFGTAKELGYPCPGMTEHEHLDEAICRCVHKLYIDGHIEAAKPESRSGR